jgi:hypothetical protein
MSGMAGFRCWRFGKDYADTLLASPLISQDGPKKVVVAMAQDTEVIFEAVRTGDWLRVAAICPRTGVESVAAGPADSRTLLQRIAAAKLARKLVVHAAERAG